MPETTANYHHVPVRSAGSFVKESFRTITISASKGIKAVIGKLKTDPQGSTKVQKYLFDVKKWTMAEAKAWVKEHKKSLSILENDRILIKKEVKDPYEFRAPVRIIKSFDRENAPEDIAADIASKYLLVFECTMSTSTKDWENDIVEWGAIEKGAEQLNKRGIVLFNHKHFDPPIGRFLKAWGVKLEKNFQGIECGEIHGYVGISKTAEQIGTLIKEGVLTDMSVGGILKDAEEFYDEDDNFEFRVIKDWDLFEGSVVNFGANPDARINHVLSKMLEEKKGGSELTKDDNPEDPIIEGDGELPPEIDVWEIIQEQLDEKLQSHKEEVVSEIEDKIEELRTQSQQDLTELREGTEESLDALNDNAEQTTHLLEYLFGQAGYEEEEDDSDENDENE